MSAESFVITLGRRWLDLHAVKVYVVPVSTFHDVEYLNRIMFSVTVDHKAAVTKTG